MPNFYITHTTTYSYASSVNDSANQVILKPKDSDSQRILDYKISLQPNTHIEYFTDYFGNEVGNFTIVSPHDKLQIIVKLSVSTNEILIPEIKLPISDQWAALNTYLGKVDFLDFVHGEQYESLEVLQPLVNKISEEKQASVLDTVMKICEYIYKNYHYQQGVTTVETGIDEIVELKAGVCQDFAHLMTEMLRILHIPARYVSGYICPSGTTMRGEGATHAWVEAYIPGYGWLGVDPTNNCYASAAHVKISIGRNFNDCTPVKGTYKGTSQHVLTVSVVIDREKESKKVLTETSLTDNKPAYVTASQPKMPESNSYRRFIEMQQQQQQQ